MNLLDEIAQEMEKAFKAGPTQPGAKPEPRCSCGRLLLAHEPFCPRCGLSNHTGVFCYQAFQEKFGSTLPDILENCDNGTHKRLKTGGKFCIVCGQNGS